MSMVSQPTPSSKDGTMISTPRTPATVAMTPSTSSTKATPELSILHSTGRALFRDDTTPSNQLLTREISKCDSMPDPISPIQFVSRRSKSPNPAQRRRSRRTHMDGGIVEPRRKFKSGRAYREFMFMDHRLTPSSTPSTSSSSEADTSPDRDTTRRRSSGPLDVKGGLYPHIYTHTQRLGLKLSRISSNGLLIVLSTVAMLSCGWTLSAVPQTTQSTHLAVTQRYSNRRVQAPSAGGLRGKLVQMAGRKDYWKQRDAHARHDASPKDRKAAKPIDRKQATKSLLFTPPIGNLLKPPSFDALDATFYATVQQKMKYTPRVMSFGSSLHHDHVDVYPAEYTDNTQYYGLFDSEDEHLKLMEVREPYESSECVPMQDWQTTYHPWCNGMHELALESMGIQAEDDAHLFGTKGFWRNAWRLDLLGGHHNASDRETIVLKTLKFEHNFEDAHFEHDRVDAVAMERLTSSPHVINIFGFCGHSVMTEFADGTCVGELADKSRKKKLARLRIAWDIANGLADVHGIDGDGNATFVHLDINPANVVSVGGTLKLNDFNIGIILRWNTTSNKQCGFPAQYPNPQWRSPEEARGEQSLTEKVDIFSMGHIFFRLICGHEPWNKLELGGKPSKEMIHEKVQMGVLPLIPDHVMNTDNKEVAAIRDVMLQCYAIDPSKRPSARVIANHLENVLNQLSAEQSKIKVSRKKSEQGGKRS